MWRSSIFLRSVRAYRTGMLGWGLGMGLVVLSVMASAGSLIGTAAQRQELVQLAGTFAWNADVVAVDTVGGYATWKIGIFMLLIAIWPVLAASRMLRGEEERGSLDALLALPRGRVRVALEKAGALWVALAGAGLLIAILVALGGRRFGAQFTTGDAALFALNLVLICAAMAGLALLISQFTVQRASAASGAGGLLVLFVVVDMVHRVIPGTGWLSRLSPVYYYNLSKPLVPGYGASAGGMLVLLLLALVLHAASVSAFVQRDIGGVVSLPRVVRRVETAGPRSPALPVADWSLKSVFARSLRMLAVPTAWWTLVMAGFAGWMVVVVHQTAATLNNLLAESSSIARAFRQLGGQGAGLDAALLGTIFLLLPIFLMAFAVTQVNRWAADEDDGRLELLLATPLSRAGVLLGRFAALSCAIAAMALVILLAAALAAAASGLLLAPGTLAGACVGMIPLALLTASLGYFGSGWLRTAADTGLLSFLLLAWLFVAFVGPDLGWPGALLRLSPLYDYGQPLTQGLSVASSLSLLALAGLALGLATVRFARKDVGV